MESSNQKETIPYSGRVRAQNHTSLNLLECAVCNNSPFAKGLWGIDKFLKQYYFFKIKHFAYGQLIKLTIMYNKNILYFTDIKKSLNFLKSRANEIRRDFPNRRLGKSKQIALVKFKRKWLLTAGCHQRTFAAS